MLSWFDSDYFTSESVTNVKPSSFLYGPSSGSKELIVISVNS